MMIMQKGDCAIEGWGVEGDKKEGKLRDFSKQFFPNRVNLKEFTKVWLQ